MDKVKAEMNNVVQTATGNRDKLEQHYKKELALQRLRRSSSKRALQGNNWRERWKQPTQVRLPCPGSWKLWKGHTDRRESQEQVRPEVGREGS
eukprot:280237-Amphidinium_carterae.1